MRPTRKSRSVNKWYDHLSEVYPVKDGDNFKRNNHRKRKLSDIAPWSKEELTLFYEAYRKYGKDWEKVAAVLRHRSVEMVESLYSVNRAYLSLPEGTASVVGLIAMMSDHYSNLVLELQARSDNEWESNYGTATSRKPQKRVRGKAEPSNSREPDGKFDAPSLTAASSNGCLPLIKTKHTGGSRLHAAGKRTPRFPVSYSCENIQGEKFLSSTRQSLKNKADVNDDVAAHAIGLALTKVSANNGCPEVYQTSNRITKNVMLSPAQTAEMKHSELKLVYGKTVESERDAEDIKGSTKDCTVELSRDRTFLNQSGRYCTLVQEGRSIDGKKLDADDSRDNHLDDQREVGQLLGVVHETPNRDAGISRSSLQGSRKRSKRVLFSRDETSAIEALQTLADLSLKMPSVGKADETMAEIKVEKDNHLQESGSLEAMPGKSQRNKRRSSGIRVKGYPSISGYKVASNEIPRSCKVSAIDDDPLPEMGKEAYQPKTTRKKPNMLVSKATHVQKMSKSKRSSQNPSSEPVKDAEHSSRTHLRREGRDPDKSTAQVFQANQISLPTRVINRRKTHRKKPQKEKAFSEQSNTVSGLIHDAAFIFKSKLLNCLSNPRLRRWCEYEWFYSAIDYPWFAKREFVEYLYHVGLEHIPKLTRVEWGVIRSSLGKPRRFSPQFLKEEKKKLNQYQDSVRKYYADLQKGTREGLPTHLARPLSVGQHVIAIHPKEREIHDGSVLTVDNSRCRVQFDRPELGVEFITDIDCMPSNHLVDKPTPFGKHMTCDKFFLNNELRMNEQAKEHKKAFCGDEIEKKNVLLQSSPTYLMANLLDWTKTRGFGNPTGHLQELKKKCCAPQKILDIMGIPHNFDS